MSHPLHVIDGEDDETAESYLRKLTGEDRRPARVPSSSSPPPPEGP